MLDVDGLDWSAVSRHPLRAGEARCLAYMMDVESHTVVTCATCCPPGRRTILT